MIPYNRVSCPRCRTRSFYTRRRKLDENNKYIEIKTEQVCIKCGYNADFYEFWEQKINPPPKIPEKEPEIPNIIKEEQERDI